MWDVKIRDGVVWCGVIWYGVVRLYVPSIAVNGKGEGVIYGGIVLTPPHPLPLYPP